MSNHKLKQRTPAAMVGDGIDDVEHRWTDPWPADCYCDLQ